MDSICKKVRSRGHCSDLEEHALVVDPPCIEGQPEALLRAGWRGTGTWVIRVQWLRISPGRNMLGTSCAGNS